tara:strand:+ start:86 stop:376 length:291 start_codon:yes stop_codon:yes gene_type:complete
MIQISKPLTGGTGSVTTGEWESGNDLDTASQASTIEDVLDALVTAGIVSSFVKDDSLSDTAKMSSRTNFVILTSRKEAVDHVIDVVNLLDNKKVMG